MTKFEVCLVCLAICATAGGQEPSTQDPPISVASPLLDLLPRPDAAPAAVAPIDPVVTVTPSGDLIITYWSPLLDLLNPAVALAAATAAAAAEAVFPPYPIAGWTLTEEASSPTTPAIPTPLLPLAPVPWWDNLAPVPLIPLWTPRFDATEALE